MAVIHDSSVKGSRWRGVKRINSVTSWPVLVVWTLLSVLVAVTSTLGFVEPAWMVRIDERTTQTTASAASTTHEPTEIVAFGVYSYCYRLEHLEDVVCRLYDGGGSWSSSDNVVDRPSDEQHHHHQQQKQQHVWGTAWRLTCVLYGSGCLFLVSCALVSVLCLSLPTHKWRHRLAVAVGHAQAAAVIILALGLAIYPVGLGGSLLVQRHCGAEATYFRSGDCQLGWSYALAIASTTLAIYCPVLAKLANRHLYEPDFYFAYCPSNLVCDV